MAEIRRHLVGGRSRDGWSSQIASTPAQSRSFKDVKCRAIKAFHARSCSCGNWKLSSTPISPSAQAARPTTFAASISAAIMASSCAGKTTFHRGRGPFGNVMVSPVMLDSSKDQEFYKRSKPRSDLIYGSGKSFSHQVAESSLESIELGEHTAYIYGSMSRTVSQPLFSEPSVELIPPLDRLEKVSHIPLKMSPVGSFQTSSRLLNNHEDNFERSYNSQNLVSPPEKPFKPLKILPTLDDIPKIKAVKCSSSHLSGTLLDLSTLNSSSKETRSLGTDSEVIPKKALGARITRKVPGPAFNAQDFLPEGTEGQGNGNTKNGILQNSLEQEAARLRDKLKEQKGKSMQAMQHKLFLHQRTYLQGDGLFCAVDPCNLTLGEFIVHKTVGVGKFIGVKNEIPPGKVNPTKYIYLKYADGVAKLKAKQASRLLYRYHLPGEVLRRPKLSKLKDRTEWEKRKNNGQLVVQKMVINMMELYVHRLNQSRPPYLKNTVGIAQFAVKFPYTPTPDQLQAFADVERDMTERDLPMDRLVCGDVGFGKTEVALRAIFICATSGKQAMVLAPSTVLAKQHYETIRDRFAYLPGIKVALLCRFQKGSERKDLILKICDGSLTIVVGTHSLLGSQIHYHNLGLLVIDEEQRFGVRQKEKITCLKNSVDVLTLSATPIPRTLYYALSGLRDASLLTTPPPERRPIRTHLGQYKEEEARAAIQFELDRGGQVFYVVPKIEGIEKLLAILQTQFPHTKISAAHGKLSPSALEDSMKRFCDGDTKILVCTNIIESGLDIQMVNTIIVEDVHHFGLAQLYQLRGRVGRAHQEAHAYLFHPHKSSLTNEALERLVALQDYFDLGQGFQLSKRDMAIRGIGSLFGEQQSGDIAKIGTGLCSEMLLEGLAKVQIPSMSHTTEIVPSVLKT